MLTRDEWKHYIEGRAKREEKPFTAYWHPRGMALMFTGVIYPDKSETYNHVPKATVTAMRRTMAKLRRKTWETVTVEFDGENITYEEA